MTQKDKNLLFLDLSARLPYGLLCSMGLDYPLPLQRIFVDRLDGILLDFYEDGKDYQVYLSEVKPYLRPLSSMTEEEKKELKKLFDAEEVTSVSICFLEGGTLEEYVSQVEYSFCAELIDWLNVHHLDYRGLIEKGLAIEATEGMYFNSITISNYGTVH